MPFVWRKTVRGPAGTRVNLSRSGASVSKRLGRVTLNSRGRGSIRVLPGLSFRFRLWR